VTIRGFYTKGEVQQEIECDNIYTRDQVPVCESISPLLSA
jgi:hypothetical protein